MDFAELLRRCRRSGEGGISYRRAFLILIVVSVFLFYLGPWLLRMLMRSSKNVQTDPLQRCMMGHTDMYLRDEKNFDAHILRQGNEEHKKSFLPYIGNGKIGLAIESDSPLRVAERGVLSLQVPFHPLVIANWEAEESSSVMVTHYLSGTVQKFECFKKEGTSVDISHRYFAHRILPSILVQDIKIVNPLEEEIYLDLIQTGALSWKGATTSNYRLDKNDVIEIIGEIESTDEVKQIAVVIIQTKISNSVRVKPHESNHLHVVTCIHYSELKPEIADMMKERLVEAAKKVESLLIEKLCDEFEQALSVNFRKLREDHVQVWKQLWSSGLSISYSKAADALNGDKINVTIYYLLSNSRAPLSEAGVSEKEKAERTFQLNQPDQCHAGHHTLQAPRLWSDLTTLQDVIRVSSLWKLTLEKRGCQTMMQAGADGIMQAILLSFGAFKFSGDHLEFGMQPEDLHRDYLFRRISYGNGTHVNVSVVVGENNKAILYAVLDRSDRNYYACDAGCLDPPVLLSEKKVQFPVKKTAPPTPILYVASSKQHLLQLKHTIHVHEINEAPAHEHHVIALHRHGHHFGGLPAMFWISITFLVAVFHLFLFKLIYNEYCTSQDKFRARHSL